MRIGELAATSGMATKTIRYYEDIGLMPAPPRTSAGYRDYGPDAPARLRFVRAAQSVGLTLGEIREVLAVRDGGQTPCPHVRGLIERHAAELTERINTLTEMRRQLRRLAQRARTTPPSAVAEFCHIIEEPS